MADFYFNVKSRHKWKMCGVCSSEEQLYGMCGLLIPTFGGFGALWPPALGQGLP